MNLHRRLPRFRHLAFLLPALFIPLANSQDSQSRIRLGDSGLSVALPPGWRTADKAPDHEETFGAFQSRDRTASWFLSAARASAQADMPQIMEGIVANFESAFLVDHIGDSKTGTLAESPAVFTTLEAQLRSANDSRTIAFRFYLAVLDTGQGLYLVQASVQKPVKPEREREVLSLLRSLAKVPR